GFQATYPASDRDYFISAISLSDSNERPANDFKHNENYHISVTVNCRGKISDVLLGIMIFDTRGKRLTTMQLPVSEKVDAGKARNFTAVVPGGVLTPNEYLVSAALHIPNLEVFDEKQNALSFKIVDNGSEFYKYSGDIGYI